MKISILTLCFGLSFYFGLSQNKRDKIVEDLLYYKIFTTENYYTSKETILKLEEEYGYEPNLKYMLLSKSFEAKDIAFFKEQLTILVRDYGLNIAYEEGKTYFHAITEGELAAWFKEMYLYNHFIWMDNNFSKITDLNKLNQINNTSLNLDNYHYHLTSKLNLDSIQKVKATDYLAEKSFENLGKLYSITRKYNQYPTAKNFALIQNNFNFTENRNYALKQNFEKTWMLFESFYKKAYLNNEISYLPYKNYDNYSFLHFKNQRFGLLKAADIPKHLNPNKLTEIPIRNPLEANQLKKTFNWKP